jgi:hypothetical protein
MRHRQLVVLCIALLLVHQLRSVCGAYNPPTQNIPCC